MSFLSTQIEFQLLFSNSEMVSVDPLNLDSISVKINDNVFKDPMKGTLINFQEDYSVEILR